MQKLLISPGGALCVPQYPMIDRKDGGNLWVMPPREVWDRSELTADELIQWSFLSAAAGRAMLEVLPQLQDGVINYWEAGNWSLNDASEPKGVKKVGRLHKKVHQHLVGRSPNSTDPDWAWGEAPFYPKYADVAPWWSSKENLNEEECCAVAERTATILVERYKVPADAVSVTAG